MKRIVLLGIMSCLTACGPSLHQQVLKEVHPGDSERAIQEKFGLPATFEATGNELIWVYKKRADVCGIAIKDSLVTWTACVPNPNYVGPLQILGSAMKGMGDGLTHTASNPAPYYAPVNCTGSTIGGITSVNCN